MEAAIGGSPKRRQNRHPADDTEVIDCHALRERWLFDGLEPELLDDGDDHHGGLVDRQVAGVNAGLDRAEGLADGGAAADG